MLQHSWSLQAVHCFYYSAFSSQHRSLHWNTTSSKAQTPSDRHPVNIIQICKTYNSTQLRVKPAKDWGVRRNRKKKILQEWTHGSWNLVHVNSEATLGSQIPPSKAQVWNLQISTHFSFLFFLHWCREDSCRTMADLATKLFQIWCLNQDHLNSDFSNTNLATHFQKLQFCAILQSFPYEIGTKLKACSFLSYGPNEYSPSLRKHMQKWGRMRPVNYCYHDSTCINGFSDSVLYAISI